MAEQDVVPAMNSRGYVFGHQEHVSKYGAKTREELLAKIRARPDVTAFQEELLGQMGAKDVCVALMNRDHAIPLRAKELIEIISRPFKAKRPLNPLRQVSYSTGQYVHPKPAEIEARLEVILERYFRENAKYPEDEWDSMLTIYDRAEMMHHDLGKLQAFRVSSYTNAVNSLADELSAYYLWLRGVVFFCKITEYGFRYEPTPDSAIVHACNARKRLNAVWLNFCECFYDRSM